MILCRHLLRAVGDLGLYAVRSGRWWVPAVVVVLGIAGLIAVTVKVVVPTAVYTLF